MALPDAFGLRRLNAAPGDEARDIFLACCSSPDWADAMVAGRPYADDAAVLAAADTALAALDDVALDEALAGHPRIGERAAANPPSSQASHDGGSWSSQEQAGMDTASSDLAAAMAAGNRSYESTFGHVYLVSAAGRSAQEMLDFLHQRLTNAPDVERGIVRAELAKINANRLTRVLALTPEATA